MPWPDSSDYSPVNCIELMKVIHCLSFEEFCEMMDYEENGYMSYPREHFCNMKKDMFTWLCSLEADQQDAVFKLAAKNYIWYSLKKEVQVK